MRKLYYFKEKGHTWGTGAWPGRESGGFGETVHKGGAVTVQLTGEKMTQPQRGGTSHIPTKGEKWREK